MKILISVLILSFSSFSFAEIQRDSYDVVMEEHSISFDTKRLRLRVRYHYLANCNRVSLVGQFAGAATSSEPFSSLFADFGVRRTAMGCRDEIETPAQITSSEFIFTNERHDEGQGWITVYLRKLDPEEGSYELIAEEIPDASSTTDR